MTSPSLGDLSAQPIPLSDLRLDPHNPRLPETDDGELGQDDLAVEMAEIFGALDVARSIAQFGFYPWEAIVVVPDDQSFVTVEGNRRLTAALGLADESLRNRFADAAEWNDVAATAQRNGNVPAEIPCVVIDSRSDAIPALGYRHISGIKPWEPQRQAAFVAHLIDDQRQSFKDVATLVGQPETWVRTTYRDFTVFEQAAMSGVDVSEAVESYSLVTVMLGKPAIRSHLGVRDKVAERSDPFDDKSDDGLVEVFEWVFGSEDQEPVIQDSRQMKTLAKVIGNPVGLESLRGGSSLEQAQQDVDVSEYDQAEVLAKELGRAVGILRSLDLSEHSDNDDLRSLAEDLADLVGEILNAFDAPGDVE